MTDEVERMAGELLRAAEEDEDDEEEEVGTLDAARSAQRSGREEQRSHSKAAKDGSGAEGNNNVGDGVDGGGGGERGGGGNGVHSVFDDEQDEQSQNGTSTSRGGGRSTGTVGDSNPAAQSVEDIMLNRFEEEGEDTEQVHTQDQEQDQELSREEDVEVTVGDKNGEDDSEQGGTTDAARESNGEAQEADDDAGLPSPVPVSVRKGASNQEARSQGLREQKVGVESNRSNTQSHENSDTDMELALSTTKELLLKLQEANLKNETLVRDVMIAKGLATQYAMKLRERERYEGESGRESSGASKKRIHEVTQAWQKSSQVGSEGRMLLQST